MDARARRIRWRSRSGNRSSSLLARSASWTRQRIEQLLQGDKPAPPDLRPPAPDCGKFGFCRRDRRRTFFKVTAQRFPHEFRARPILRFPNLFHLLDHCGWKGDGHGLAGSHIGYDSVLLYVTMRRSEKAAKMPTPAPPASGLRIPSRFRKWPGTPAVPEEMR